MKTPPKKPEAAEDKQRAPAAADDEPGTNEVQHEPDPKAEPLPDGHHKYVPRSPFTTGNY